MRPTWHSSSSKCPPDISQLHITVPCPVSGCPLERDHAAGRWLLPHLGHQGVGSEPGSLVFLPQPSAQPGLLPSQALVLCSAQTLKPLCFFHNVRDATHWTSLVLRCAFFFHIWTPLKSVCILQLMKDHSSVGSVVLTGTENNSVSYNRQMSTSVETCFCHSRTYSFVIYFLLIFFLLSYYFYFLLFLAVKVLKLLFLQRCLHECRYYCYFRIAFVQTDKKFN